jgi:uncharacterized protein (TIGR00369 family)
VTGAGVPDEVDRRIRRQFDRQGFMHLLGARIHEVADGAVTLALDTRPELAQQHGFVHAGAVTTLLDTACGFAALTRMEPGTGVLTAEFKVNLLRPAAGEVVLATGRVIQAGRTLVVCEGRATARQTGGEERLVAVMTATMACVRGRPDVVD